MDGRYGLLGERLGHSFSPLIHANLAEYDYRLIEKAADELDVFFAKEPFDGINVTIPYKQAVVKYCGKLSETAKLIGSVNTIVRHADGTLYGDNTDFFGLEYLFAKAKIDCSKKILVLGSGGSSLAVRAVLDSRRCRRVVVVSRSGENNYDNLELHYDAEYIINTTPVGMYPGNGVSPIADLSGFAELQAVVDLIYNPAKTELMMQAEAQGVRVINGLPMLVAQAKRAAEIFTGERIDHDEVERIVELVTKQTRNIVLIGMPGCGKTTVGMALAQMTGREFIDTDKMVEAFAERAITQIFEESGESAFRLLETLMLRQACKESGKIIATGGGVITREINRGIIRQNGTAVFMDREVNELATSGRPVSLNGNIRELAAKRMPVYNEWADFTVKVEGVQKTAEGIKKITM